MSLSDYVLPAVAGFLLGGGLIIAIGAQNAYVLRLGLARKHVFPIAAVCAISDAILIAAGAAGVGSLVAASPALTDAAAVGGALFLAGYAVLALRNAFRRHALDPGAVGVPTTTCTALMVALAFTWLNPHVYLDTLVLVGSIAGQYAPGPRTAFAVGAILASFVWFFGLGYGARLLTPIFRRPISWRVLDVLIAIVMASIAIGLVATVTGNPDASAP